MLPATTNMMGMSMAFPDVCKTPAPPAPFVPIPYPAISMTPTMNPATSPFKSFIMCMKPASMMTMHMMNMPHGGVMGGMVSQTFMGPSTHMLGSTAVFMEGRPASYLGAMTGQNGMGVSNAPPGLTIVPSQPKVLIRP